MASPKPASPIQDSRTVIKKEVLNNNTVKTEASKEASAASEAGGHPVAYNNYARNLLLVHK